MFDSLLLMVYFGSKSQDAIEGSAVMVAPGVALSATLVINDWISAMIREKRDVGYQASSIVGRLIGAQPVPG